MPRFRATYVRPDGRLETVTLDAVDSPSLVSHIEDRRRGFVVQVRPMPVRGAPAARLRVPQPALLAAMDSLGLMLRSGVRINAALRTLAESAAPGPGRRLWTDLVKAVEDTGNFADSIGRYPRVFGTSAVGVIAAHERAGRLADGVRHVRDYVSQMQVIRRESIRALAYPSLVCVAGLVATVVLCVFTLPRFAKMLADIGANHPNPLTSFFFGLSSFVTGHPLQACAIALVPAVLIWLALRPRFRPILDSAVLRIPFARGAAEALSMARICLTYRTLTGSGVRVVEALESCMAAAGNAVFSRGIARVIDSVRANTSVGEGFERAGVFSPELVLAIRSGENDLPQVFERLGEYYTDESKHRIAVALGMLEPAMLVLVLVWVLGVALAVVLPVVEVINEVH